MPTEDSQTTSPSQPAALMRAAQAIVDRRRQMAAAAAPATAAGDDPPPPGTATSLTPRAPDPGASSFQGVDARPGQLLGSINTLTAPAPDGPGYEVRHADSGRLIAQGGSADEAERRAQDLAGWLGRRRLTGWLQADSSPPQITSQKDNTAASSAASGGSPREAHGLEKVDFLRSSPNYWSHTVSRSILPLRRLTPRLQVP